MKRSSIVFGKPGQVWRNDSVRVRYQFFCSWMNTCGACAQYDSAIGPIWPIPIHIGCRCYQRAIMPGREAEPFTDFLQISRELDSSQVQALVGKSNWRLIDRKIVAWDEVVTPSRVRRFREVVARSKITREVLKENGVSSAAIEQAMASIDTPPARLAAEHRRALVELIEQAGVPREAIVSEVASKLAEQIVIRPTPTPSPTLDRPDGGGVSTEDMGDVAKVVHAIKSGRRIPAFAGSVIAIGRVLATSLAASEISRRLEESRAANRDRDK